MAIPALGQFITADLDGIDLPQMNLSSFGWHPMDHGVLSMMVRSGLAPGTPTWESARDFYLGFWPDSPIVFWGLAMHSDFAANCFGHTLPATASISPTRRRTA